MDPIEKVIRAAEEASIPHKHKKRREPSPEMLREREATSTVQGLEAKSEKEKERLAAESNRRKKEVNKYWIHVFRGGTPQ